MEKERKTAESQKLLLWQKRLADSAGAFEPEVKKMDERERLYNGDRELKPLVRGDIQRGGGARQTSHVRNIIFENIEAQVSSSIPQPKVTPRRKKDEHLAEIIEHFLRNELDRLPFETMNDMAERTVPIQGGVGFLIEWDNGARTHNTLGEVAVSLIHPKQFAPQPGIYTGIGDMDWFILKLPTTKETVKRKYGVDVSDEAESEPDVRAALSGDTAEDALTQYIGFEINDRGGINRYSWVNDVELEDLENYQARRQPVCKNCGRVRPLPGQIIRDPGQGFAPAGAGEVSPPRGRVSDGPISLDAPGGGRFLPRRETDWSTFLPTRYENGPCPWCGGESFSGEEQDFETVMVPMETRSGLEIPGMHPGLDEFGAPAMLPTLIPFYKPDIYPIILQRNVSVYGQLLGNSDVDVIRDQQNTVNRMEQKIIDRLVKAGTRITLPDKANLRTDPEDGERWFLSSAAEKAVIGVYDFKGDLEYELLYLANVYEEARQILGITDSFQGRRDTTATSGKAKEFSAAQAAGRLESKRVMKNAAYALIFEIMFKFWLAYSDEPRPVSYKNSEGETVFAEFNRYDFLEQDADGTYWWNDQFLFSCDTSEPLSSNREAMWQETRLNLQSGAFGDPAATDTLILFWSKMEELHYPGAGTTRKFLEERRQREQQAMTRQAQQPRQQIPPELASAIEQKARRDAEAAVMGGRQPNG